MNYLSYLRRVRLGYSGIRIIIIPEYILAILLLGVESPEWKSRYSRMRIALKQMLTRIVPIILLLFQIDPK